MNEWTRLLLYGTYDGFSRSTEGENNINLILDNGDKVEVPNHFVKNASDFVERNKIKLKDIIARMEGLNGLTRIEWLDDILYKFGSNYGASKYKLGYEQGRLESEWVGQQLKNADKIRQEINKPTIPQFVADWIEYCKENNTISLSGAFEYAKEEVDIWLSDWTNQETFARAWLDGYTVEKEKRYRVKVKGMNRINGYLAYNKINGAWYFGISGNSKNHSTNHTRKELEQAGFGWVFDCEGIEIEEVVE